MKFIIRGRPITKKNGKTFSFRGGKTRLLSKESFITYENEALRQLERLGLTKITGIENNRAVYTSSICFTQPVFICYLFYIKGEYDVDTDNTEASINDILQKANILANDNLIKKHYTEKVRGWDEFFTVLDICPADSVKVNIKYISEEFIHAGVTKH